MDLGAALEAARSAWKAENRNKMYRFVLARQMGYGSLNGHALGKIDAVRAYRIVDGSGEELRLSDGAITALASPDEADFKSRNALLRLVLKPSLFRKFRKSSRTRSQANTI